MSIHFSDKDKTFKLDTNNSSYIIAVYEENYLLNLYYPDKKCLGGAPLNFAAHFAKHGGESYMLSALGNDELGISALRKLSDWKVNSEYVSVLNDSPTGRCKFTLVSVMSPKKDMHLFVRKS